MERNQNLNELFSKFLDKKCNREELHRLFVYFHTTDEKTLRNLIEKEWQREEDLTDNLTEAENQHLHNVYEQIKGQLDTSGKTRVLPYRLIFYVAAAVVLFVLGISLYTHTAKSPVTDRQLTSRYGGDALPASNRATLTLSSGKTVKLRDDQTGVISDEQGISYADGNSITEANEVQYITLATPRAGRYQVQLSDGTKVWLNAESSLHYPMSFSGNERKVELTGEAYFEVAHNAEKPFVVLSGHNSIEVLGTQFNVDAYGDTYELTTTLVEGSIRLSADKQEKSIRLIPGQQAVLNKGNIMVNEVDTDAFTSWKNGLMTLNNYDMQTIIKHIERWYDVQFEGVDRLNPKAKLSGELPNNIKLSELLSALETHTGAKFSIEGRRVIITK